MNYKVVLCESLVLQLNFLLLYHKVLCGTSKSTKKEKTAYSKETKHSFKSVKSSYKFALLKSNLTRDGSAF